MSFRRRLSPLMYAAICAGAYFAVAVLWVHYSTLIAGSTAASVEELERIEKLKGTGFVVVTSSMFFLFSLSVFRHMSAGARRLIESQQRLIQSEREAMSGLLASSVAHDISNLLTVLRINAERLESMESVSDRGVEMIRKIQSGIDRLAEMSSRMRQAGRNILKEDPHEFNLMSVIQETLGFVRNHRVVRGCTIELNGESWVEAKGYPILIHQMIMNLVLNAAEATAGAGRIEVRARRNDTGVVVEVHDNGPGIPLNLRESVFDAFFSTKKFGSGLGLLSVKSCVDIHGGEVWVEDSHLGGAAFIARLPDLNSARILTLKRSELLNKMIDSSRSELTH